MTPKIPIAAKDSPTLHYYYYYYYYIKSNDTTTLNCNYTATATSTSTETAIANVQNIHQKSVQTEHSHICLNCNQHETHNDNPFSSNRHHNLNLYFSA